MGCLESYKELLLGFVFEAVLALLAVMIVELKLDFHRSLNTMKT